MKAILLQAAKWLREGKSLPSQRTLKAVAVLATAVPSPCAERVFVKASKKVYRLLLSADPQVLTKFGAVAGCPVREEPLSVPERLVRGEVLHDRYRFSVDVKDYVKCARRLLTDVTWKLVNRPLKDGKVWLKEREAKRLVAEAAYWFVKRLAEEARELGLHKSVKELVPDAAELLECGEAEEGKLPVPAVVPGKGGKLPPCIQAIAERAEKGENLSHAERLVLLFFALNVGMSDEEIVALYSKLPDFDEKKTRYFVQHARRRGYRSYSCEKIRSMGLCPVKECPVKGKRSPVGVYIALNSGKEHKGGEKRKGRGKRCRGGQGQES